jgi:hypothetical protein
MVRHDKTAIMRQVPAPQLEVVLLEPHPEERRGYNSLVSFLRGNITLTLMKGKEVQGKQDSLLQQPKYMREGKRGLGPRAVLPR